MTLFGGAAAAPLAAQALQPERMRRIGVLTGSAADDQEARARKIRAWGTRGSSSLVSLMLWSIAASLASGTKSVALTPRVVCHTVPSGSRSLIVRLPLTVVS